jgi:YD repeat-containing protein
MSLRMFFSTVLLAAVMNAADMPVTVSEVTTGAQSHVKLTNRSSQPVTAWSLAATTIAGGRTHRDVYTADGYLSEVTHGLPGSSERLERLMPGQTRQISIDPLPAGATVNVIAAVLDDGTAIGEEEAVASIFARRAKERDALKAVVDAFNDVLPTTHGAAALAALKERFSALAQRDDSMPCRAALDAVQNFERKGSADEIDRSLGGYADFVKREYELAARHSQRKRAV